MIQEIKSILEKGEYELIQNLWAGYGKLIRLTTIEGSFVVKHIEYPKSVDHKRGWGGSFADKRKRKSYEVELNFYKNHSERIQSVCRIPNLIDFEVRESEMILVLEDLNESGFSLLKENWTFQELKIGLEWLARFHAENVDIVKDDLWDQGTYWHLDTRLEEYESMRDGEHKEKAKEWGYQLKNAEFQTLVHGDAKYANFLWNDNNEIAGVDFQYCGRGVGVKDVIYLLSCDTSNKEKYKVLNDYYFEVLEEELRLQTSAIDIPSLIKEWRGLLPIAQKDFERFLIGWAPDHWKLS